MPRRKQFTREFKLEAVRFMDKGEKPASELARESFKVPTLINPV